MIIERRSNYVNRNGFSNIYPTSWRSCFIEAEGKPSTLNNFITTYNSSYSPSITLQTDGIICLEEDANKWGLELRLYLHFAPTCIHATKNSVYRNDYSYRINDVSVIKELFTLGYRIGLN